MPKETPVEVGMGVLMHNDASFAHECLESLAREWRGSWNQVTILISGSVDGTDRLVTNWVASRSADQRPTVEISARNLGPMGGLIRLLELCQQNHMVVLHGDDVLLDGFFDALAGEQRRLDSSTVIVRDLTTLEKVDRHPWVSTRVVERSLVSTSSAWNQYAMTIYNIAGIGGAVLPVPYCRKLLEERQLPNLMCAEDWYLFSRVLAAGGTILRTKNSHYGYRLHPRNTTKSSLQPYSVGFIRAMHNRQEMRVLRLISKLQTVRERRTFADTDEYDRGLRDGSDQADSGNFVLQLGSGWIALPFLLTLEVAKRVLPLRTSRTTSLD